jgi:hypothetical protein
MQINISKLTDHWSSILPNNYNYYSFKDYALQFKEYPDFWNNCQDGKYMLLWAANDLSISRQQLVYAACQVARLVLPFVKQGEERPRIAIETAEKWCKGKATIKEVEKAASTAAINANAAFGAAYAAYAASHSVADASYAAAAAASVSYVAGYYNSATYLNTRRKMEE